MDLFSSPHTLSLRARGLGEAQLKTWELRGRADRPCTMPGITLITPLLTDAFYITQRGAERDVL